MMCMRGFIHSPSCVFSLWWERARGMYLSRARARCCASPDSLFNHFVFADRIIRGLGPSVVEVGRRCDEQPLAVTQPITDCCRSPLPMSTQGRPGRDVEEIDDVMGRSTPVADAGFVSGGFPQRMVDSNVLSHVRVLSRAYVGIIDTAC